LAAGGARRYSSVGGGQRIGACDSTGKIVVAGGPWFTPAGNSYIYDVARDVWTPYAALLHPTRNYGAALLDGFIYALGGYDFGIGLPGGASFSQRLDVHGKPPTVGPTSTVTSTPRQPTTVPPTNTVPPTTR